MFSWIVKSLSILMVFFVVACANVDHRNISGLSDIEAVGERKILVVNTNAQVERYQVAEEAFAGLFTKENVVSVNLANDSEPLELLLDQLNTDDYDAIYCIGAKSLGLVDYIAPELPVVYSSVLNWRKFQDNDSFYGVASEVSLVAQLTWFKYFFPGLESVGVIYSQKNEALISEAVQVASRLNINLVSEKVEAGENIQAVAEDLMSDVQALWLISDYAVLASEDKADSVFKLAESKRIPVLTYNDLFVDMGALLSISADLPTMGRQAALIMREVLNNETPAASVVYPAGSRIVLNQATLEKSGLKINEDAMDSLNDIRY